MPFGFFDPTYLLMLAPAFLLAMWAQYRVRSTYHQAQQLPARMTGAAAARELLDASGLHDVGIEMTPGHLSDHYDPRAKVLRLSPEVYQSRSLAAVGIAAHEAGHAIQDAQRYAPLVIRNAAVPVASFGSGFGILLLMIGGALSYSGAGSLGGILVQAGLALFGAVVFFQVVNLPVEFNASSRAKDQLAMMGIVDHAGMIEVNRVLNAAALTYVAATLQTVLQLLYFVMRFAGGSREE